MDRFADTWNDSRDKNMRRQINAKLEQIWTETSRHTFEAFRLWLEGTYEYDGFQIDSFFDLDSDDIAQFEAFSERRITPAFPSESARTEEKQSVSCANWRFFLGIRQPVADPSWTELDSAKAVAGKYPVKDATNIYLLPEGVSRNDSWRRINEAMPDYIERTGNHPTPGK